jgi:hypothetical protein
MACTLWTHLAPSPNERMEIPASVLAKLVLLRLLGLFAAIPIAEYRFKRLQTLGAHSLTLFLETGGWKPPEPAASRFPGSILI